MLMKEGKLNGSITANMTPKEKQKTLFPNSESNNQPNDSGDCSPNFR